MSAGDERLGVTPTPDAGERLSPVRLWDEATRPHLRAREAGLAPVLDRLADEHKTIHKVLEDVDAALVEHLRNPGSFDALQEAADILSDVLLSHLAYEEAQLLEPLARHGFYGGQL